jgi:nucleoside-diphosphate-sugar epimerase
MIRTIYLLSTLLALSTSVWGFAATVSAPNGAAQAVMSSLEVKDVVTKVAVAGATGRVGRLVVDELLDRGVTDVVALVRDPAAAEEVFSDVPEGLTIIKCDISNEREMKKGESNKSYGFFLVKNVTKILNNNSFSIGFGGLLDVVCHWI